MRYQLQDLNGDVIEEFDDYHDAHEWQVLIHLEQGPVARLVAIDD